ncbi:MAG: hypothetical protein AABZ39_07450 [Spirochaetota bacterium]
MICRNVPLVLLSVFVNTMCFAADTNIPGVNCGSLPADITQFFIAPDTASSIYFTNKEAESALSCTVYDYSGSIIGTETLTRTDDGPYRLLLKLPRGYYEISFTDGERFGVVSIDPVSNADTFFGMDTWMSWAEKRPDVRARLIRIIARCGISIARERVNLGDIRSGPDAWSWNKDYRYDDIRTVYRENGVDVLELMHGSPVYLRGKEKWPFDQSGAQAMYRGMIEHFTGRWKAAEVQNEPDLRSQPGNFYPVQVKAVSYAFASMRSAVPVVAGVTGTLPPSDWFTACGENGMLDDADVFSYHDYESTLAAESLVTRARAWLKRYGCETMPLWHTESGWSWPAGTARPDRVSDSKSALEIIGKAVEDRASGVARFFPFCLLYYIEGKKNFGMMGQEFTPLRSLAAYAYCVSALSGTRYIGDLAVADTSIKRARVFSGMKGEMATVIVFTGENTSSSAAFPFPSVHVAGIDGRALTADGRSIPVPDGICYVIVRTRDIRDSLRTDTSAMRLYAMGERPMARERRASPVVLQLSEDAFPAQRAASKYGITRETARSMTIKVRIDNLSSNTISARAELALPGDGERYPLGPITIPSLGASDLVWNAIDASRALDISEVRFIKVNAAIGGSAAPSPLAIPLLMEGTLEEHLARHGSVRELPVTDLLRWKKNTSSPGECSFSAASGLFRADLEFKSGWAYPQFSLSGERFTPSDTGFLVRVRMAKKGSFIDLNARTRTALFRRSDFMAADGEWHAVYVPFADLAPQGAGNQNAQFDPSLAECIEVGMNTATPNTIEVSHIYVIGK